MAASAEIASQIAQLEEARKHVLADAAHYEAIIPGILPIIGLHAPVEIRRWGADFLAEGFASPALAMHLKERLAVKVVPLLSDLLELPDQDELVVRGVIQSCATIYGLVFRHITNHRDDADTWNRMTMIKTNILKRWDVSPAGISICCIKFVQKVVQVQTLGVITDPRRQEQNEISLALVPRDHALIPPPKLEAEATGLLDRLLSVFYENNRDAILVDATLNCLAVLVNTRLSISNKIISAVLNFNPVAGIPLELSPRERVAIRSMEQTVKAFLTNALKRDENAPFASRIEHHIARMKKMRQGYMEEGSRKRGPSDPVDGLDNAKRVRLGANTNGQTAVPPLPSGPVSVAQLYTLTSDEALMTFDATPIPLDLIVKIAVPVLQRVDSGLLLDAINAIRTRYLDLDRQFASKAAASAAADHTAEDEDDEYEPEFEPKEDNEQILNALDVSPTELAKVAPEIAIGPFELPQPPPLSSSEAEKLGKECVGRVFGIMSRNSDVVKAARPGLNRIAATSADQDSWLTITTRLATRGLPTLPLGEEGDEPRDRMAPKGLHIADEIRQMLWRYVVDDFRHRIGVAITWLNEEWYNDRVQLMSFRSSISELGHGNGIPPPEPHYEKWVLKLLDAIVPYLDANDKILVRFLGEIPEVGQSVLDRIKALAKDPDRVTLAAKAIYYLIAFKPPAKEMAIDALEDLWRNYEGAKDAVRPYLARVRPSVLVAPEAIKREAEDGYSPGPAGVPGSSRESLAPEKQMSPSAVAAVG